MKKSQSKGEDEKTKRSTSLVIPQIKNSRINRINKANIKIKQISK